MLKSIPTITPVIKPAALDASTSEMPVDASKLPVSVTKSPTDNKVECVASTA